jgi:hypothetical protein
MPLSEVFLDAVGGERLRVIVENPESEVLVTYPFRYDELLDKGFLFYDIRQHK